MKKLNKVCNTCGNTHDERPEQARAWIETDQGMKLVVGYFWECSCGSTMFQGTLAPTERKALFSKIHLKQNLSKQ